MPASKTTTDQDDAPDDGSAESSGVTSDSLAADVADEDLEYLDGTPELVPMLVLRRHRKADAYEALGQITTWQRQVRTADDAEPELDDEGNEKPREIDPASYGAQYRVVALVEDYLRVVAADPVAFDAWAALVDDADLIKTFNTYLRKAQPGEAESSAG